MGLRLLILDLFTSHRVKYLYLLPLYESERRRLDTFIDYHYLEEIGGDWRRLDTPPSCEPRLALFDDETVTVERSEHLPHGALREPR